MGRKSRKARRAPGNSRSLLRILLRGILAILIALIVCLIAVLATGSIVTIDGTAMAPSLLQGDQVLVSGLGYLVYSPRRGDLVRIHLSAGEGSDVIRRIIALPGETIQIMDGKVYINGRELDEEAYESGTIQYAGTASTPLTLQEDQYFVMSDSRSNNFDSRDATVGSISEKEISGQVWIRVYPLRRFGLVREVSS